MATSGTTAFTLDLSEIIEEAYERIGMEFRSGYDYKTARRSLDLLMLEWQNRGLNMWAVKNATEDLVAGTASYTLTPEKLDVIESSLRQGSGTSQSDLTMRRISVSEYAHITNKLTQGRPIQFYVEQTDDGITLNLWPVPDSSDYSINYWYFDRIEDTGKPASNNMEVPVRYLPCLVSGLAYYLALKTPTAMQMAPALKQVYEEQWMLAADSAREKASIFIQPGGYGTI